MEALQRSTAQLRGMLSSGLLLARGAQRASEDAEAAYAAAAQAFAALDYRNIRLQTAIHETNVSSSEASPPHSLFTTVSTVHPLTYL
jgi:hypothetical protein